MKKYEMHIYKTLDFNYNYLFYYVLLLLIHHSVYFNVITYLNNNVIINKNNIILLTFKVVFHDKIIYFTMYHNYS